MNRTSTFWSLSLLMFVGCASPNLESASEALDAGASAVGLTSTGFPSVTDFAAAGPYATTTESSPADCTIYRPATLGAGGVRHPVVVWGNGTTSTPSFYNALLTHWASHGFVVAAANTPNAGTGAEMKACMEWVIAENGRAGSSYQGRIDTARIAAAGHSQGGGGAIMLGRDPRIVATVPLCPYTIGLGHDSASDSQQRGPMFLVSGGMDVIAIPTLNQKPVYDATNVPVVWGTLLTAGHYAALGDAGHYRGPMTAWLRARLMDDASGRAQFEGSCALCSASDWKVRRRGI